jgi:hypothetical protein
MDFDYPDRELSMYTCAHTEWVAIGGMEILERVRVCSNPGEHLCLRKRGHAYCDEHYNPKSSSEDIMRKRLEKERDIQGEKDAEAFAAEAKRLREELGGSAEERREVGLFRKEVEQKEEFLSGVILL